MLRGEECGLKTLPCSTAGSKPSVSHTLGKARIKPGASHTVGMDSVFLSSFPKAFLFSHKICFFHFNQNIKTSLSHRSLIHSLKLIASFSSDYYFYTYMLCCYIHLHVTIRITHTHTFVWLHCTESVSWFWVCMIAGLTIWRWTEKNWDGFQFYFCEDLKWKENTAFSILYMLYITTQHRSSTRNEAKPC